jgi:K+-sensing histidine kinase KdpD
VNEIASIRAELSEAIAARQQAERELEEWKRLAKQSGDKYVAIHADRARLREVVQSQAPFAALLELRADLTASEQALARAETERDISDLQVAAFKADLLVSEQSRETLRTALEPLARKEHDRAIRANALFSVEHWKHNAGPDWPEKPDDDSFAAFENCKHPLCALAASQPAGMTTKPDA